MPLSLAASFRVLPYGALAADCVVVGPADLGLHLASQRRGHHEPRRGVECVARRGENGEAGQNLSRALLASGARGRPPPRASPCSPRRETGPPRAGETRFPGVLVFRTVSRPCFKDVLVSRTSFLTCGLWKTPERCPCFRGVVADLGGYRERAAFPRREGRGGRRCRSSIEVAGGHLRCEDVHVQAARGIGVVAGVPVDAFQALGDPRVDCHLAPVVPHEPLERLLAVETELFGMASVDGDDGLVEAPAAGELSCSMPLYESGPFCPHRQLWAVGSPPFRLAGNGSIAAKRRARNTAPILQAKHQAPASTGHQWIADCVA